MKWIKLGHRLKLNKLTFKINLERSQLKLKSL